MLYVIMVVEMSKSESGRLVLEIDPDLKRKLYAVLALEQKTIKRMVYRIFVILCERKTQSRVGQFRE